MVRVFSFVSLLSVALVGAACSTSSSSSGDAAEDTVREKGAKKATKKREPSSEIPARREFPVDATVNPCDDFYAYTCNEVNASFKLREDRSRHVFSFSDSHERILEAKKKYLAELSGLDAKTERQRALKNVYVACMDPEAAKTEEKAAIERIKSEVLALDSHEAFQTYVAEKIPSAHSSVFSFGGIANQDDPDWQDLYLLTGMRTLPERSYYDKAPVVADLEALAVHFFETIGVDNAADRAKKLVDFEKRDSNTYPLPAEFRDLVSSKTGVTRAELSSKYSAFKFDALLSRIPEKTHIRHFTPANYDFWQKALTEEPLDTLKSVYLFHALPKYLDDAYPEHYQKRFEFRHKHLGGPAKRPERDERCTQMLMSRFLKELDAEMLPKIFPDFPEEKFVGLVEKVRAQVIDGIEKSDFLSEQGKAEAKKKMTAARLQVVKPKTDEEWDFNPPAEYSPKTPYKNLEVLDTNLVEREITRMAEKRNKDRWWMGPLTINAYYSPADNKFVMPIGILQYPFYDPKLPDHVNFGAVGGVVGHELGHGIDDKGSKYDSTGALRQWMSDEDLKEFTSRGSKLIAQFDDSGHNGKLTLGENIGDFVGLTFGYRTAFPEGKGSVEDKQAFFLQWGRVWCNVMRPKQRELRLKTDPHALGWARVNEQVKHQPGFQEAFGCKDTDKMVLKDRVKIW